jgi:cobalt-zinc-cadmium efflux system outer membrane protein
MLGRVRLWEPLVCALLAGCVAHDSAADHAAVRALVSEHQPHAHEVAAYVATPSRDSPGQPAPPEVEQLAAQPLTLDSAVRIALLNNRELRAELLGLGVARGQLVQASVFPNLDFEAEVRFSEDPAGGPQWDFGAGFDLTQLILRGSRRGVAEAELSVARIEAAGATLDLAYQVRLAYCDVQASARELELLRSAQQAFAASSEAAQVLHDAGNLTDLDLSNERAAEQGAELELLRAEADALDVRERLNVLLGLFGQDTGWRIAGPLPEPTADLADLEHLESRAIRASLELAATRSTLDAAARRLGLTSTAGWLPNLHLEAHAEHDGKYWEVGPALTGSLPLFNRSQGDALSQQAQLEQLRERYTAAAITIRAATRSARARALSSERRARQYKEQLLPLRERIVAQTLLEYNAMQVGVFQLLEARRQQLETQRAYVNALRDYWRERATLEQLIAGRLAGTFTSNEPRRPAAAHGQEP